VVAFSTTTLQLQQVCVEGEFLETTP